MLLTKENIDIYYRTYLKQFKTTKKYIESRKGTVRMSTPMTRSEFETDFVSTVYDEPNKSGNQIAKKMAKQDLFKVSYAQGVRIAEAHERLFGEKATIDLIQKYRLQIKDSIWNEVELARANLKTQGFKNDAIKIIIGQQFFGSN